MKRHGAAKSAGKVGTTHLCNLTATLDQLECRHGCDFIASRKGLLLVYVDFLRSVEVVVETYEELDLGELLGELGEDRGDRVAWSTPYLGLVCYVVCERTAWKSASQRG